ncbi:MAG: Gfo/Idh/MocA family oxidoreductase, partial [Chloroflexota bacterium]
MQIVGGGDVDDLHIRMGNDLLPIRCIFGNITTPNNLHLEIVQAAVEAGKHIFCEKPVGR